MSTDHLNTKNSKHADYKNVFISLNNVFFSVAAVSAFRKSATLKSISIRFTKFNFFYYIAWNSLTNQTEHRAFS